MRYSLKILTLVVTLFYSLLAFAGDEKSDEGSLLISFAQPLYELGLHQINDVSFTISTSEGVPVSGLKLDVQGGMPGHGHGFPTSPYVEEQEGGTYTLRGISFSMRGEWLLVIKVSNEGTTTDQFTLPIYIKQ